jgi:uncharacterized damage-inducible protein DinB
MTLEMSDKMTYDMQEKFLSTVKKVEDLKKLPEYVLTKPIKENKWSIREIIGHLFYWDKYNLENMVPKMENQAILPSFPNHDSYNADAIKYINRFESAEKILEAFVTTRKELTSKLRNVNANITFSIQGEPNTFNITSFIDIFLEHDLHHLNQIEDFLEQNQFKIIPIGDYSPQIGHLVSMMNYARYTTLNDVKGLTEKALDYLPYSEANSIGALLLHMAAVEIGFQIEIFDGRKPNEQEVSEWGAAYSLGEQGRKAIKGYPLEFYIEKLDKVRNRTLEEFKRKDDNWLYEQRLWDNNLSNNYFIWYHVMEDEINHRGQIRILKKMFTIK